MRSAYYAAGVTGALAQAGLSDGAVHHWFRVPRDELGGLVPADALDLGLGRTVVDLARRDVAELVSFTTRGGTRCHEAPEPGPSRAPQRAPATPPVSEARP